MISQRVVRKLIPQLIDGTDNVFSCGQQRIVSFILFATDVLVFRQVLTMRVVLGGISRIVVVICGSIITCRLVHSIMIMVGGCFPCKGFGQTLNIRLLVAMAVVRIVVPLPLIRLIYQNSLRPSCATLQNTAGDGAITYCKRVGITIRIIINAAIDVHYRIHTISQLACDEALQIVCIDGFIYLFIGHVLEHEIGHVVEVDMQVFICIISRINDFAIRLYFGEGVAVSVLIMHALVKQIIAQQNIIHAGSLGERLQFGTVLRHHGIDDFFVTTVIVGYLRKCVRVSVFRLISECHRQT